MTTMVTKMMTRVSMLTHFFAAPQPDPFAGNGSVVEDGSTQVMEPMELPVEAKQAQAMILAGRAPAGLCVKGHLSFANNRNLTYLPECLSADSLDVSGCENLRALPEGLHVRRLNVSGCTRLTELPEGMSLYELTAREVPLSSLPSGLNVEYRLDLTGCTRLIFLPRNLKVGSLVLANCTALESLPENLDVYFLDISGCASLLEWPERASVRIGRLSAAGCAHIRALPSWLRNLSQLDVSGCPDLRRLPDDLRVSSWLDIAGTGITSLPASMRGVQLRWRGVPIDERIAFQPETITVSEVLNQPNAELRRVLLERMGYDKFLSEADARVVDRDSDPGGERRLLQVPLPGDEPLACLAVYCPSTGHQYMLRVPPAMRSCHQAAAWIAGFDNAKDYRPVAEA